MNLSLAITGRRPDGYHDLDSLMFAISLYDTVTVTASPARRASVSCTVTGPEKVPGGPSNLAARAAAAVMEGLGVTARVRVRASQGGALRGWARRREQRRGGGDPGASRLCSAAG